MIDNRVRRMAVLACAALAVAAPSACTLVADQEQKRTVRANLDALPDDVDRALRPGKVRLHFHGETGDDVSADRQIRLAVGTPPATTTGGWVAGCQAATAALADTSGRLYGRLPGAEPIYQATDDLCQRGLGHPLGSSDKPALWIGLPQPDGRVLDTAVDVNVTKRTVETFGWKRRVRGDVLAVAEAVPAELDAAVAATAPPWRYRPPADPPTGDDGWLHLTFVVPAGTRLRVAAGCGEVAPDKHVRLDPRADGSYLSFGEGPPSRFPDRRDELAACGDDLVRELRPQFSYRSAAGVPVDRYQFVVIPTTWRTDPHPAREIVVDS